ncbi:MAG: 4-hydroxy-tetrahydrodipicolinate reductase [Deltaproteobacteria bacterium]|nr:4-hydroxy-tetrahydrodipicolinate reductase [Deltaproteobacteria bacterium]
MIRIGILGAHGKMGTHLRTLLERKKFPNLKFECGFSQEEGNLFKKLTPETISTVSVLIDFTHAQATESYLPLFEECGSRVVIGTTGFTSTQLEKIKKAANRCPILLSPNMSIGVNLLFYLAQMAAQKLPPEFTSHILELHHSQKKDRPSGTALKLKELIEPHRNQAIDISAIRGGDITGEHTVYFMGQGERLELSHKATSREIFALGALTAAEWLYDQKPGLYSMKDVFQKQWEEK